MLKHSLPSIERFAAYLDGNLSKSEMQQFSNLAEHDKVLRSLLDASDIIDDTIISYDENDSLLPDELNGSDFTILDVENVGAANPLDSNYTDNVQHNNQEVVQGNESLKDDSLLHSGTDMLEKVSYCIYGEEGENELDPIFIKQPDDHSCGLRSQQIILRDFGIDIPFSDLESIAKNAGVYSDDGTSTYDVGKVLEIAGVGMHQVQGCTIYDLVNELSQGHRIIVSVDADELWYNNSLKGKLANWLNDVFGSQGGNHALIVAGIEVNPHDTNDVKVVLTDPGTGHLRTEYPLHQFVDAWKDSNCFMVATNEAAPYQYDVNTHMEVPSNFMTGHQYNQFVVEHSYQLDSNQINVSIGYQPTFAGHINLFDDNSEIDKKGNLNSNESGRIGTIDELTISDPLCEISRIDGTDLEDLLDAPSGYDDLKEPLAGHDIQNLSITDYNEQGNPPFTTEEEIGFND